MADFSYTCPWCDKQVDMTAFYEYEDLVCEFIDQTRCPYCSKPVVVDITVTADVWVEKDDSAIAAEREKYEKRMRGGLVVSFGDGNLHEKCEQYKRKLGAANARERRYKQRIKELEAAYDELTAAVADLCRLCGFHMVDASGEVIE